MRAASALASLGRGRPSLRLGLLTASTAVALATAAVYPLRAIAPVVSLGVVYLPAVLLVSAVWGLRLGLLTSLASATAYNYFHLPPVGRFTIADGRNWVALAAFGLVAVVVSTMADVARTRALDAERRRAEADLAAALARELLSGHRTEAALGAAARRIAQALPAGSAAIELRAPGPETMRQLSLPLHGPDGQPLATLTLPRGLPAATLERLRSRILPTLEALIAVALERDAVQAEAVESAALRRSDELKTALLRAVSHDLRTPVTAIVTAGHALGSGSLSDEERAALSAAVVEEGERLSALIDKLLDLSRLQAGRAEPRRDWVSLEDVLIAAQEGLGDRGDPIRLRAASDVPLLLADAAQLERVFANLLENALRYSGGASVTVHVRRAGTRVLIRVTDQGPGISAPEQERIFEPFYRGGAGSGPGAGLGLAIARGFAEANGGTIDVESLPGQGTSFIVGLPVPEPVEVAQP